MISISFFAAATAAALPGPQFERPSAVAAGGRRAEAGRIDRELQHPQPRLVQAREEEPFEPPHVRPLRELLQGGPVRHPVQPHLLQEGRADLHQVAEAAVRLPRVLAERQQQDVLAIVVDMVCEFRSAMRASRPLQDPLSPPYDANQSIPLATIPIPRHEVIPSPELGSSLV